MENPASTKPTPAKAPFKPFVIAALYAATVVGIGMFFQYGGGRYGIGQIAGIVAFGVTFFWALVFAPLFYFAKREFSEINYFLLHLGIGLGFGAMRAARNPYVTEIHQYIYNNDAIVVSCASMAAWLYVVLLVKPGDANDKRRLRIRKEYSPFALFVALAVLAIPISTAPKPTDPSCHNTLRNGRMSASPSVRIRMTIAEDEISELTRVYEQFAADYGLSIRGHALLPEAAQRNICNEDVTISAGGVFKNGRHGIGFYQSEHGSGWEPMASDLICRLESRWADTMIYTGGGGEEIHKPEIVALGCRE